MKYETIAKLLTMFIVSKKKRKEIRSKLIVYLYCRKYCPQILKNAKKIGTHFWCRSPSTCTPNTYIGNDVSFNGMRMEGDGKVVFGNHVHTGTECLIITRSHNYEGTEIPYDSTHIYKDILIADFVWIGSRVTILPETEIGEGAIIQGGSVVHGKIPPYAIAGGNPATVFKYRNKEHFLQLKAQKKYHFPDDD